MSGEMTPELDVQEFESRGLKVLTGHAITREWSSGSLEGGFSFNEALINLDGVFHKSTPVDQLAPLWTAATEYAVGDVVRPPTPNAHIYKVSRIGTPLSALNEGTATSGGTAPTFPTTAGGIVTEGTGADQIEWTEVGADTAVASRRDYEIDDLGADNIQTYTVEQGDKARTRKYVSTYVMVTSLSVSSERAGEVEVSSDLLGRRLKSSATAVTTAGVLEADTVYATPEMVEVYMDDSSASLGTTKMVNASIEIELSDRFSPSWFHDRTLESYLDHVETRYSLELTMQMAEGSVIDDLLSKARAGQRKFVRFDILGPQINTAAGQPSGVRYRFQWDIACQISDSYSFSDEDGVYMVEVSMAAVRDGAWGRSNKAFLVHKKAA
jgi:hypothetical protein